MDEQSVVAMSVPAETTPVQPSGCGCGMSTASAATSLFVYALGTVSYRFPSVSLEKEFRQVASIVELPSGSTDAEHTHAVLSSPGARYLARQLCWVLTIEGIETYLLKPRFPDDLTSLLGCLRPRPSRSDMDVVIGLRGPTAGADLCNGLMLPIVFFDQIYSFDQASLISSIPNPADADKEVFERTAEEVLSRVLTMADNAGTADEHRALNYLVLRYPAIYTRVFQEHQDGMALSSLTVRASRLSGSRNIVDVILTFRSRRTDSHGKWFVRVDVTEEFPFLVSPLAPYFDRDSF